MVQRAQSKRLVLVNSANILLIENPDSLLLFCCCCCCFAAMAGFVSGRWSATAWSRTARRSSWTSACSKSATRTAVTCATCAAWSPSRTSRPTHSSAVAARIRHRYRVLLSKSQSFLNRSVFFLFTSIYNPGQNYVGQACRMHCLDHRSVFHMETNVLWDKFYFPPLPQCNIVRKEESSEGGSERIVQQFGKKALCPTHFGQDCSIVCLRTCTPVHHSSTLSLPRVINLKFLWQPHQKNRTTVWRAWLFIAYSDER